MGAPTNPKYQESGSVTVRRVLVAGFAFLVMSGCLGGATPLLTSTSGPAAPTSWVERALRMPTGHDHNDPEHHKNMSSSNIDEVGWSPLSSPYYDGTTMPGYSCAVTDPTSTGAAGKPKMLYAISYATDVAFVAVNISDPANPQWVSEFLLPNAHTDDIRMTANGKYVVVASERKQDSDKPILAQPLAGASRGSDAGCPGRPVLPSAPVPPSDHIYVVNVEDPRHPQYVTSAQIPHPTGPVGGDQPFTGPHMLKVADIGGRTYIFAFVAFGLIAPRVGEEMAYGSWMTSHVYIYELSASGTSGKLDLRSIVTVTPTMPFDPTSLALLHDGDVRRHPVTHQMLLYIAAWDDGVVIYNVDDPSNPKEVGRWTDYKMLDKYEVSGNVHHVLAIDGLWNGRHYTFTGPENFYGPTGYSYVLDTTDPAHPTLAGKWRLPIIAERNDWPGPFAYSPHFFRLIDRTLVMAHFHAGVWFIDFSDPAHPKEIATFMPDRVPEKVYESRRVLNFLPAVVDLEVMDDMTYALDWQSGIYVVKVDRTRAP
jgi:hypothetical protein